MADPEMWWHQLAQAGYKRTGPREVLLAEVARRTAPFSVADIYRAVRGAGPPIGRATVFRTLDSLATRGLIGRIGDDRAGAGAVYVACGPSHHHHLICSACKGVWDFVVGDLETLIAGVAAAQCFAMAGHRLELYGVCAGCREQANAAGVAPADHPAG